MEPVTLEAEGLRLGRWRPSHIPALAEIYEDREIERFFVMPLPWPREARERHLDLMRRHWSVGNPQWAVTDDTGRLVGSVGLRGSGPRMYTITYLTAPWARGRGVAQRAVRAASHFAFRKLDAARISWDAICGNHYSRLTAVRTGFTIEGLSRSAVYQRGTMRDVWIGGILPGEVREADDPPPEYRRLKAQAVYFSHEQAPVETDLPGLRLRPLRSGDLADIAAACRDEAVQRNTTVPANYTRASAEAYLKTVRRSWERGTHVHFALEWEGRYSGTVSLKLRDAAEAEIGYLTAPWARGRGAMTEAVGRMADLAFRELDLEVLRWCAVEGNKPSVRVAEKNGFTIEGVRHERYRNGGERIAQHFGYLKRRLGALGARVGSDAR
ncbi:GNAT family N-acetyltransferase [Salininema proteolyticum]|uniref:GNAT family N-acetyltransferase n=1 Tax=Salininema proteolyticum TaxID=1607685 RepID=A0ABV8U4R6_9ACTN